MIEWFETHQSDIFIIGILVIEIVVLTILGINTLKKSRSLANVYFSTVFFVVVGLSAVNIVIRFLSIEIGNKNLEADSTIVQLYMDLVLVVTAAMVVIFIIYGAGFYIINFGEKYYRDKKLFIVFIIVIILVGGSIIGSRFLPYDLHLGLEFDNSGVYDEFFKINNALAIYLGVVTIIFVILDVALLIRILPEADSKAQKRKIYGLMLVIFVYFLGLVNLIVVDMHIIKGVSPNEEPAWTFLTITSVLFLFSVLLLYFSIVRRKRKQKVDS
ncbi:MAG: hypothetical protein ACTSRE_10770 [Promethearchaeota archaeon]